MTCTLLCGCCGSDCGTADASLDYAAINAQAAEQYLRPIRPGYEGRNPFWNGFAKKFIYAPAFDFDEVAGAANYRFTVVPLGEETQASWSFTADSPKAALTPVWGEIPVGRVRLTVEGLDASGKVLGKAGEREFLRDYPFTGPYTPAVRDYRQAALMGLLYIHRMPEIQYWAEHTEPDMNYRHNTYPCKIIGATIRAEALLARLLPAHKEQATRIARNAAQFLIDQSRPAGDPLAFFPPTYYKDLIASKRTENQNKTMTMEAASAGHAFLDLYDLTGDKAYYDRALGIADTYVRLQREDGSLPIKVDFVTGEPVNDACAMLHPLLRYFQRLKADYGVETYAEAQAEGERWMRDVAIRNFDMTGQFEDVTVLGLQPYENLTNCTAAPYAAYLLSKEAPSAEDLADAVDLARFSEDQFPSGTRRSPRTGSRTRQRPASTSSTNTRNRSTTAPATSRTRCSASTRLPARKSTWPRAKRSSTTSPSCRTRSTGRFPPHGTSAPRRATATARTGSTAPTPPSPRCCDWKSSSPRDKNNLPTPRTADAYGRIRPPYASFVRPQPAAAYDTTPAIRRPGRQILA